jgi:fibronectin type 3 domain-containing protein
MFVRTRPIRPATAVIAILAMTLSLAIGFPAASSAADDAGCAPYSTLACDQLVPGSPGTNDFSADPGGLAGSDGIGTGFTMVQPNTAGDQWQPDHVAVDTSAGQLTIQAEPGIAYVDNNNQQNTLGVGLHADGAITTLTTTIVDPFASATSMSEQAGLWFGPDQANFVKLVAQNVGNGQLGVQLTRELNDAKPDSSIDQRPTGTLAGTLLPTDTVRLTMVLDAGTGTVTGSYAVKHQSDTDFGTATELPGPALTLPAQFFDGTTLATQTSGATAFGGIFATSRKNLAGVAYHFDSFSATTVAPPTAPGGFSATGHDGSVALDWSDNPASDSVTEYDVYRSTTSPVSTTGTPYATTAATTSEYTDEAVTNGALYYYAVTAVNENGSSAPTESLMAQPDVAEPTMPGIPAQINFQPELAPVPDGFTPANGQPYSNTRGFGWVRQDSLTGTHIPVDLNSIGSHTVQSDGNTRDRNRTGIEQLQDTLIHMQYGDLTGSGNTNGNPTPGAFEYDVPDGSYTVTVSVGDQPGTASDTCDAPCYDSVYTINVEGVTAIDRFQATPAAEYQVATVTVPVTDGRLTIDAIGGTNTKLDYVTIEAAAATQAPADTQAPAAPADLAAVAGDGSVALSWSANSESDLAGYNVYRAEGDSVDATGTKLNDGLVTGASFTDSTAVNGTQYAYVVTAVDDAQNESVPSQVVTATPQAPASTECTADQYRAEYFDNNSLSGTPVAVDCEDAIDNDWGHGGPPQLTVVDNFSIRWTRSLTIDAQSAGEYLLTSTADDGMTVSVDGTLVLDNGGDHSAQTKTAVTTLAIGDHSIVVEYHENGFSAVAQFSMAPAASSSCDAGQYRAEYFDNETFSGDPVATSCDDTIDNDWGAGHPAELSVSDNFSVRWTKDFTSDAANYTFASTSDDGMIVSVDGATVLDNGGLHGAQTRVASADLTAGSHHLVVSYSEHAGDAVARFSYYPTPGASNCPAGQFNAEYFDNTGLSGDPVTTRCETAIDYNYHDGAPTGVDVGTDNFSARWTQVQAFSAGEYTFTLNSDDGSRVLVDGQLVLDEWGDHGPATASVTIPLSADTHRVVVEYYEHTGGALIQFTEVPAGGQTSCTGSQYQAEYFDSNDLSGTPVTVRCEDSIDHDYGTSHPVGVDVGDDNFSVRWTQVHDFGDGGTYDFQATSDDGMMVFLDGQLIIDNGGSHGPQTRTAPVGVPAGTHTLVVEYFELTGGAVARFGYTPEPTDTSCTGSQYTAQYFANSNWSGQPVVTRCDDAINFDYGLSGPDVEGVGTDNFSVRWTQVHDFAAGDYSFTSTSDDGMLVFLDGTLLLDNGGSHGPQEKAVTTTVSAGPHTVTVRYMELSGGALARFSYESLTPQAPDAPTGLTAGAGDGQVSLSWDAVPGATGYNVYRSTTGTPDITGTPLNSAPIGATDYTDVTAGNGITYRYVVTALNDAMQSAASNEVTATPTDDTPPAAPTGLTATAGDGSVDLAWNPNVESDVAGYDLYRSTGANPVDVNGTPINASLIVARPQEPGSYHDTSVVNGSTYHYLLVAVDLDGNRSEPSNQADASPTDSTPPAVPTGLAAVVGDATVTLTWTAGTEADLAGYNVYRSSGSTPVDTTGTPLNGATLLSLPSYTDTGLSNGTTYHYAVTAVDTAGNESAASASMDATPQASSGSCAPYSTLPCAEVVPASPVSLDFSADEGGLADSNSVGTGFTMVQPNTAGDQWQPGNLTVDTADHQLLINATAGIQYWNNNTQQNALGVGLHTVGSVTTLSTVVVNPYANPTNSLSEQAGLWFGPDQDNVVKLVVQTAGSGKLGVQMTREVDGSNVQPVADTDQLPTSLPSNVLPTDTVKLTLVANATAGTISGSYSLKHQGDSDFGATTELGELTLGAFFFDGSTLAAQDSGATGFGGIFATSRKHGSDLVYRFASFTATTTGTVDTPPAAPTGLAAVAGDGTVDLSWTANTEPDLAGYNLYRSSGSAPVDTGGTPLNMALIVANTTYHDTGLTNGVVYHYRLVAVDSAGQSSDPSSTVDATPVPIPDVHAKINFQPSTAPVPAGYTPESGDPYSDATGMGWVRQDSLNGTHVPLDLHSTGAHTELSDGNTRDRNRTGIDQLLDTLIHMQYGDITGTGNVNGNPTPGAFEYAVPDGTYQVTVSVGDEPGGTKTGCPSPCYDSVHTINVEGTLAIDHFQATATDEYKQATVTVLVTDGRLTIDAIGGTNTKLDYVTIDAVAPDTTPPSPPTDLTAVPGDSSVSLSWTAGTESDLAGYRVYRSTTGTPDPTTDTPLNQNLLSTPSYADTTAVNGTAYHYVVTAVDASGNESAASVVETATPAPGLSTDIKVNFSDEATVPPSGYVKDFGQAFGPRTDIDEGTGLIYGWVNVGTSTPLDLVGNGRNRNTQEEPANQPDLRLATFVHMQLPTNATGGVSIPGSWEMAVPNGPYTVTVAVGDAGTAVDSEHWINIEDQNAIARFIPTLTDKFATATRTVVVTDGRLTLSPESGTNTKLDYVTIDSVPAAANRPYVNAQQIVNLDTNVPVDSDIVEDLHLPNGAVDATTLTSATITMTAVGTGTVVAAHYATSGGGDTINISPDSPLTAQTLYRVSISDGVTDINGDAFLPYSAVFTTGGTGGGPTGPIGFDKADSGAVSHFYTNMTKGPDGKMYAATIDGYIMRYTINPDGTLSDPQTITTVRDHAVQAGLFGAPGRSVIGLAFDPASTADNLKVWITDNPEFVGVYNMPDFGSYLAYLSGPNLESYTTVLAHLPRSVKDHETNSIAFGPDGALYFTQGANNAMGEADSTWGNRPEHLLNAAVLRLDTSKLPASLPLDVTTVDVGGPYDPFAPGAPLTIYASGIRNAYDLVWHSNGHLYTPTNGSAAGGSTPATPDPLPEACTKWRIDGTPYTGPTVPGITNNGQAQTDFVYDVKQGRYYGHPNPSRCEWVLDNGNPTSGSDPFQVDRYPVGTQPDRNYDLADSYDAGLHASADGAVEYKGNAFGGALNGKLLVVRYSSGQDIETFDVAADGKLSNRTTGITGFTGFDQPLALWEDTATGNLYVSETGGTPKLTLLRPQGGGGNPTIQASGRVLVNAVQGSTATGDETITNAGGAPLTINSLAIANDPADATYGAHAASFSLLSPPALPATLAPGDSVTLHVRFSPTAAGPQGAVLNIACNDPTSPTESVELRGLGTAGLGGSNEPSLQWILDTEQIDVATGTDDPSTITMPSTASAIGDEVLIPAFTKADTDAPVTVQPIALFGPAGPSGDANVVHVAAYDPADPTGSTQGILDEANGSNQSITPVAANMQDFDPAGSFGLSFSWPALGHTSYQTDSLNTWEPDAAARHKVRIYPLVDGTGTAAPNSYVVAPEDIAAPNVDYQDAVLIVRNVKPAPVANDAVLQVQNLDGFPSADRMIFSRIQDPRTDKEPDHPQLVHDTATLRIGNTGTDPMTITGLPITGPWTLPDAPTLPATVNPGDHIDVAVKFVATGGDLNTGTLTVQTDAGTGTDKVIDLAGFWQSVSEGGQEPTVAEIVKMVGWTTVIPTNLDENGSVVAVGDEVLSPFWQRQDTSKPIEVTQVTAYHTWNNSATFHVETTGGSSLGSLSINGDSAQSVLPYISGSRTQLARKTFTPSATTFGFSVDGYHSDDTKNGGSANCTGACGHYVRFFPVKDGDGVRVPGEYYMIMDYSGVNYDYNDCTYLITNIKPDTPVPPTGVNAAAGNHQVTVTWDVSPDVAGYRVYRGTTDQVDTTGTPLSGPDLITGGAYVDSTATNGTTFYYVVVAVSSGGTASAPSAALGATPAAPGAVNVHINFQLDTASVPDGYIADTGAPFSATRGYGWVVPGTHTPTDLTLSARDRGAPSDQRLATLILMQGGDTQTQAGPGSWEYAIPAGTYQVTVSAGDAAYTDSVHQINVEGVPAIVGFAPTASDLFETGSVTVNVTDGRLTVDANGGTNTKINYIDIVAAGDTQAPAAPTGLSATASASGVTLDWSDNTDSDLYGYNVYRSGTQDGTYTMLNVVPLSESTFTDTTAPSGTSFYRVTAVDASGNESAPATASATRTGPAPGTSTVRINAGGAAQTVGGVSWSGCSTTGSCTGYVSGGGFAYSEGDTITGIPAGMNNAIFQSEWTGGQSGGTPVPVGQSAFAFNIPVTNGAYDVTLYFAELNKTSAGTRVFDVKLNGTTVLDHFDIWSQAGGIDKAISRTFPVTVTDGTVSIDFIREVENAKVSAISITPASS